MKFQESALEGKSGEIEGVILEGGERGMDRVRRALRPGYCLRAARGILAGGGPILIGTGFPVAGSFETDGPLGAIALYRVLEHLGRQPWFGCAPPISRVLGGSFRTLEIPIAGWEETRPFVQRALAELRPGALVSIERPGIAADGRYYNMRGEDISDRLAKFDLFFDLFEGFTVGVGDGGNEIGMGNAREALADLPIRPSVTGCRELVIAAVSNWGAYGIIACMGLLSGEDLFDLFDPLEILRDLVDRGAVDGRTCAASCTEDGFPLAVGLERIARLRRLCRP
ncbi:MAG: glutamate cyclase domain-containing protein [Desulfobacterales bacterium]